MQQQLDAAAGAGTGGQSGAEERTTAQPARGGLSTNGLAAVFATLPVPTRQRLVRTLLSAATPQAQPGRSQVQVEALQAVFAAICAMTIVGLPAES
jgi:hypothetical protein